MKNENKLTGYPSIDKPWLKYYSEEAINAQLPNCTVYEYMYRNNEKYPRNIAIDYMGNKISFAELFEDIDNVADAFLGLGVKSGDVVTIVSLQCVTSVLCFYALNKIGAVSNYVNVLSTEQEMEEYIKDANSKYVVSLDFFTKNVVNAAKKCDVKRVIVYSLKEYMPAITKSLFSLKTKKLLNDIKDEKIIMKWKDFLKKSKCTISRQYNKDPNAVCVYGHTGGTTGFPKTVLLNDQSVNAIAHQYYLTFERERGQRFMNIIIPFVIYGLVSCMHMPLSLGLTLIVIPKFDDTNWAGYMKKQKPDFISAIPSFMLPMLKEPKMENVDISFLKLVAVGGEGITESLENDMNSFFKAHNCNIELIKGYGMSEVCASAVTGMNGVNKIGSVGIPLVKNMIRVINTDNQKECKYNEIGELCLKCPATMIGYKDNEMATSELIHINSEGERWVHTGDLAYIDNDGFVFLVGRIKRIILVGNSGMGYKVFPNIIEEKIKEVQEVFQVCVIGATKGNDKVIRACVVLKKYCEMDVTHIENKLRDIFERDMAEFNRPTYYEFIDELPLTAAGKVDYRKLEEMYEI